MLFDAIVNVGYSRADEKGEDERDNVVLSTLLTLPSTEQLTTQEGITYPNIDIDGIKDGQKGETPSNTIDDYPLSRVEELVNNGAEEK